MPKPMPMPTPTPMPTLIAHCPCPSPCPSPCPRRLRRAQVDQRNGELGPVLVEGSMEIGHVLRFIEEKSCCCVRSTNTCVLFVVYYFKLEKSCLARWRGTCLWMGLVTPMSSPTWPGLAGQSCSTIRMALAGSSMGLFGPPLPQTSQAAEWVAWAVAHQVASGPSRIFSDCLNVTRAHAKPLESNLRHSFPFAGIVRSTLSDQGSRHIEGCIKVKAHLSLSHNMSHELRQRTMANERADHFAKLGAKQHPGPSEVQSAGWAQDLEDLGHFASLVANIWQLWPKLPKAERPVPVPGARPRRRARGPADPNAVKHSWAFGMGRWQCTSCAKACMDDKSRDLFKNRSCPSGGIPLLVRLARGASGHNLMVASCQGFDLVFCSTCGRWATMRFSGLFSPCCGGQSTAGTLALARIARGEHPTVSVLVGPAHKVGDDGVIIYPVMRPAQIRMAALLARVRAGQ